MRIRFSAIFFVFVLALLNMPSSRAYVIDPNTGFMDLGSINPSFWAYPPAYGSSASYNASTNKYYMWQKYDLIRGVNWYDWNLNNQISLVADDFLGRFDLEATIDNNGKFYGGSFSLVGGSVTLGINPDTTILAGSLHSFNLGNGVEFLSNPSVVDPIFKATFGPINTLVIRQVAAFTNFANSFGGTAGSSGVELFGTPRRIPEPATLAIFGVGLAGVASLRRRRRAI